MSIFDTTPLRPGWKVDRLCAIQGLAEHPAWQTLVKQALETQAKRD